MRKVPCCLLVFLFLMSGTLIAQDESLPRVEIFGGYSSFRLPRSFSLGRPGIITTETDWLHGWNVTVTGNLNRWFGAEADFGGISGTVEIINLRGFAEPRLEDVDFRSYLFGPRLSYRNLQRFTPFVHALFGAIVLDRDPIANTSRSDFARAVVRYSMIQLVYFYHLPANLEKKEVEICVCYSPSHSRMSLSTRWLRRKKLDSF